MGTEQVKRAAMYLRLSREDSNYGVSESIQSQKMLLKAYAVKHHYQIIAIYADDGISGTSDDRPGFRAMLDAVEKGMIHTILVKDLSRLSRDYVKTGELLEHFFPVHQVRFISVCDGIDTAKTTSANAFSPMRAVLDDFYARDISQKVRAAIYARQQHGFCTAARLPYGYQRCSEGIVTNQTQEAVIRQIFGQVMYGVSICEIARKLSEQGIPAPSGCSSRWNDRTVGRILKNPVYSGKLMLHTTQKLNNKSKRKKQLPSTQWISYSVPPIIEQAQFDTVQALLKSKAHIKAEKHLLSGKIICGECGSQMTIASSQRVYCNGRKKGNGCQNASMMINDIEQILKAIFLQDKIKEYKEALPFLIHEIRISSKTTELCLCYQDPRSVNRTDIIDNGFTPHSLHGNECCNKCDEQCYHSTDSQSRQENRI